jgi:hypothetical protein
LGVCAGNQILDDASGHGLRLFAVHQKTIDAKGSVDAPPAVALSVDDHEDISRKEWR